MKDKSKPREQIIKLKPLKMQGSIWKKISREVRIFNGMNIIMMARHGVPIMYSEWLNRLLINPKSRPSSAKSFESLIYLYAAARLFTTTSDPLVRKQLYKNCLYVFGAGTNINNCKKTFICKQNSNIVSLFSYPQPTYKLMAGESFSKFTLRSKNIRFAESYTVEKTSNGAVIKNYVDKTLPVQCYEILQGNHRFIWNCSHDKMKTNISHTSDTFWWSSIPPMESPSNKKNNSDAKKEYADIGAVLVLGSKVNFETSLAEKTPELNLYVNASAGSQIFIVYGNSKSQIASTIATIKKRGGRLDYLLSASEADSISITQKLYNKAKISHFVTGSNLKSRYQATQKIIPTLSLPTLVYDVKEPQDFFDIIDNFNHFKQITHTNQNLNVVILHSSQNELIQNHIKAFTDLNKAQDLIKSGVFLFFVDRIKASSDVIYYLSKMSENKIVSKKQNLSNNNIATEHINTTTFPITHTAVCYNKSPKPQSELITIPIELMHFHSVSRKNAQLTAINLRTGRTTLYKLPNGSHVYDAAKNSIEKLESITNKLEISVNAKFSPHEEKIFTIVKNENALSIKERRNAFLGALENIKVISTNHTLEKIFTLPMAHTEDYSLLDSLKSALKNLNQNMFFALLSTQTSITPDAFALVIEKVIGLKLLRGKIQIVPNTIISGAFKLSFDYNGTTYLFTIKQKNGGFSVLHNGIKYSNFLQIGV